MLSWEIKNFEELSLSELYEVMRIRAEIFVKEQNCAYNDLDNKDNIAKHLLAKEKNKIIAYARIFKEGDFYEEKMAIGRILVSEKKRKEKIGHKLVQKGIDYCKQNYPNKVIKISAQSQLREFYKKIGFVYKGETYLEDGIPHSSMYFFY